MSDFTTTRLGDRVAFDPDPCDGQPVVEIRSPGSSPIFAFSPATGPLADVALAAQNAALAAESLGLGTVFVGAIRNRPLEFAAELGPYLEKLDGRDA